MENENISEDRFKGEMTRLMGVVIQKIDSLGSRFDGLETRFDGLETRFDGLETRFDGLEIRFDNLEQKVDKNSKKLDILVGQFTDVTSKVIFNDKRLTKVEADVAELQSNVH
jgi:uncharacterized coiled-coil protein SlyX